MIAAKKTGPNFDEKWVQTRFNQVDMHLEKLVGCGFGSGYITPDERRGAKADCKLALHAIKQDTAKVKGEAAGSSIFWALVLAQNRSGQSSKCSSRRGTAGWREYLHLTRLDTLHMCIPRVPRLQAWRRGTAGRLARWMSRRSGHWKRCTPISTSTRAILKSPPKVSTSMGVVTARSRVRVTYMCV